MRPLSLALASASLAAITALTWTGTASAQQTASAENATLGEIVVTARRRSESLQEVPQTVNAVSADTLQKLNIRQFADVQNVVPGLSLTASPDGYRQTASLRGISYNQNTGAQPTVAWYLNDAPVSINFLFQALYDIGQVEILKGPQGTTRGISAPSGAITVASRRPDLSEFGGYAETTLTDLQGRNVQGAINVPLVKDVLALRVAALHDENSIDGVRSIHNDLRPRATTDGVRASISYEPGDWLNANLVYQHLDHAQSSFAQVSGPGQGAFTIGATTYPASVNPPLTPEQRISVQDLPNESSTHFDVVVAQLDSRFFGQHLSYVGSYQHQKITTLDEGFPPAAGDVGNLLPGIGLREVVFTAQPETTHEIRLASDPAPGRFLDYTVGAYYDWKEQGGHITHPGPLTPGAFGFGALPDLAAFNAAYQIPINIDIPGSFQETSVFGSVTLHLGPDTELSGGIRHMWTVVQNHTTITTATGLIHINGLGDFSIPGGRVVSDLNNRTSETPNIYNVSLSHHFTRNFLAYANTGTSYRPPVASVGIQGALASSTIPVLHDLNFHPSERSRAYEVGVKSTWLDGRARLNASVFRQRFHNLTIYVPGISYLAAPGAVATASNFDFTASVDALVQGFDVDTAMQITPDWNVSAQMSYAHGQIEGSLVPCNIPGVYNTAGLVSLCPGGSSSRSPLWNATFQSEYIRPVRDNVDGFFRVLANYYPENKYAEPNFVTPGYGLVNLYLGVRSHDGAWEASVFARNALGAERALDVGTQQANLNTALGTFFSSPSLGLVRPSGYFVTTETARREVGVSVHYAFGSR